MKYTSEQLSACLTRVTVSVEAEEVNAAITAALTLQQKGLSLAGFRKGHVPLGIIEKRFGAQIYADASQDLVNVHVNQILSELNLEPVTPLNVQPDPLLFRKGESAEYTVSFEHLPEVTIPDYEGLEVEQTEPAAPPEKVVEDLLSRMRNDYVKYLPINGEGPAKDGQYANVDLDVLENGKVIQKAQGSEYEVGQQGAMAELDDLIRTLKVGETGEKAVHFPDDFFNPSLKGKDAVLRVHIHSIKNRVLPTDEELLREKNKESMEDLRRECVDSYQANLKTLYRGKAQNTLLQKLLKMTEFELPPSLVETELKSYIERERMRAQRAGKALTEEQEADIRAKNMDKAIESVRSHVFLLAVARKEGLNADEREIESRITYQAMSMGTNPQELYNYYRESGHLFAVRDMIRTDKAAQALYAKAKVVLVPEKEPEPAAQAPEAGAQAPEAAAQAPETPAQAPEAPASEAGQAD